MLRRLHIVCLDVPYPPDYGGAIDMFYKIKYLSEAGTKIILHCFEYGRGKSRELERYCEQVYYYERKKTLPIKIPYIVSSRKDNLLLKRLLNDDYPVLLEGIHCTYYLHNGSLKHKNVWIRVHNIESAYYRNMAKYAANPLKTIYYNRESKLLTGYEYDLFAQANLMAISDNDLRRLKHAGAVNSYLVPLFIDKMTVTSMVGRGDYCLYHGNLSVAENEEAALFVVKEIAPYVKAKFIVAGKNPGDRLKSACRKQSVELVENPDDHHMDELLHNAHINILPFFNDTGVKVKLVYALFKGRFVISNIAIDGVRFSDLYTFAKSPAAYRTATLQLLKQEFTREEIQKRKTALAHYFDPAVNAQEIIKLVFN